MGSNNGRSAWEYGLHRIVSTLAEGRQPMSKVLAVVLICLSICLSSCKRSSSVTPTGTSDVRIGTNGWGHCCMWKGDEIIYVLFLREVHPNPAGPTSIGGTGTITEEIVSEHRNVVVDGKTFSLKFSSAAPETINIAGVQYSFTNGRIFLCSVENDLVVVRQVDAPIERTSDHQQEMLRLATTESIQKFFSATPAQDSTLR